MGIVGRLLGVNRKKSVKQLKRNDASASADNYFVYELEIGTELPQGSEKKKFFAFFQEKEKPTSVKKLAKDQVELITKKDGSMEFELLGKMEGKTGHLILSDDPRLDKNFETKKEEYLKKPSEHGVKTRIKNGIATIDQNTTKKLKGIIKSRHKEETEKEERKRQEERKKKEEQLSTFDKQLAELLTKEGYDLPSFGVEPNSFKYLCRRNEKTKKTTVILPASDDEDTYNERMEQLRKVLYPDDQVTFVIPYFQDNKWYGIVEDCNFQRESYEFQRESYGDNSHVLNFIANYAKNDYFDEFILVRDKQSQITLDEKTKDIEGNKCYHITLSDGKSGILYAGTPNKKGKEYIYSLTEKKLSICPEDNHFVYPDEDTDINEQTHFYMRYLTEDGTADFVQIEPLKERDIGGELTGRYSFPESSIIENINIKEYKRKRRKEKERKRKEEQSRNSRESESVKQQQQKDTERQLSEFDKQLAELLTKEGYDLPSFGVEPNSFKYLCRRNEKTKKTTVILPASDDEDTYNERMEQLRKVLYPDDQVTFVIPYFQDNKWYGIVEDCNFQRESYEFQRESYGDNSHVLNFIANYAKNDYFDEFILVRDKQSQITLDEKTKDIEGNKCYHITLSDGKSGILYAGTPNKKGKEYIYSLTEKKLSICPEDNHFVYPDEDTDINEQTHFYMRYLTEDGTADFVQIEPLKERDIGGELTGRYSFPESSIIENINIKEYKRKRRKEQRKREEEEEKRFTEEERQLSSESFAVSLYQYINSKRSQKEKDLKEGKAGKTKEKIGQMYADAQLTDGGISSFFSDFFLVEEKEGGETKYEDKYDSVKHVVIDSGKRTQEATESYSSEEKVYLIKKQSGKTIVLLHPIDGTYFTNGKYEQEKEQEIFRDQLDKFQKKYKECHPKEDLGSEITFAVPLNTGCHWVMKYGQYDVDNTQIIGETVQIADSLKDGRQEDDWSCGYHTAMACAELATHGYEQFKNMEQGRIDQAKDRKLAIMTMLSEILEKNDALWNKIERLIYESGVDTYWHSNNEEERKKVEKEKEKVPNRKSKLSAFVNIETVLKDAENVCCSGVSQNKNNQRKGRN